MIQRIQSLFLLVVSASFFAHFLWPMASSNMPAGQFLADSIFEVKDHVILIALTILGGALAIVNITMFRNRGLQLRLGYLLIVLSILLPIVSYLLFMNEGAQLPEALQVDDQFGLYLPIISIVFAVLANRFIKKDDQLVRSMDRLR